MWTDVQCQQEADVRDGWIDLTSNKKKQQNERAIQGTKHRKDNIPELHTLSSPVRSTFLPKAHWFRPLIQALWGLFWATLLRKDMQKSSYATVEVQELNWNRTLQWSEQLPWRMLILNKSSTPNFRSFVSIITEFGTLLLRVAASLGEISEADKRGFRGPNEEL